MNDSTLASFPRAGQMLDRFFFAVLVLSGLSSACPGRDGIIPAGKDGKPLNLGFETGTLKDWTAEGTAFDGQPILGDTVSARRPDMRSRHDGQYWIGGYERKGDDPQGTLTSAAFPVLHPHASFLVAGGPYPQTRVEIVRADTKKVIFTVSGAEAEDLRPVYVDLKAHVGKEIFIRIVDERSGPWAHINFDDFRFHAERPVLVNAIDPTAQRADDVPPPDVVKFAGLSGEDAAREATVPEGFTLHLFAAEPEVKQPIAMALDDRGRVWVAEAYTYPIRAHEGQGKDRILIFEDTDGDHRFDKRTVFVEGLNLVSGLEVGFGGVWVGAAPYLLFIPDHDGDDRPDGEPRAVLDGWAYQDTHETLNTFTWGPDGWLYGCHGVFTHSNVGRPGARDSERTRINAAVWRYHPLKQQFEIFAEGTSNPWGVDFDDKGQCFIEACVIPHLFHMIQGARYTRQGGQHFNPFTYDDITTIADHLHYAGSKGPHAGNSRSDTAGGGHAHAGLMVYLGQSWPEQWRGQLFMGNIHGQRINRDVPHRAGSGFSASHAPDFVNFNDRWSQVLNLLYDADGSVYMIDWYDKNQCHHGDPNGHDRTNGRIFKLVYGKTPTTRADLAKSSDEELARLTASGSEWHVRHARRLLQERSADGKPKGAAALLSTLRTHPDSSRRLRALWALRATGAADEALLLEVLGSADEYLRAWAVQLLCEERRPPQRALSAFARMARSDPSPVVRLYLLCGLQRTPLEERWEVIEGLLAHGEDAGDHNIPLMAWYALEPLVSADPARALALASRSPLPRVLQFAVRRSVRAGDDAVPAAVVRTLAAAADDASRLEVLRGLADGLRARRSAAMPEGWPTIEARLEKSASGEVRVLATSLALLFGSVEARSGLRATLADAGEEVGARRSALAALLKVRDPELPSTLLGLLETESLRAEALRALAGYDEPRAAAKILAVYPALNEAERREALGTLAGRAVSAIALLAAVEEGRVPRADLRADLIRQLRALKSAELDEQIARVWGSFRESAADRVAEIDRYREIYRAGGSQPGDATRGRAVFARTCQQCHTLFGTGGKVGPDITGSNRSDLDYILQNILDPNAVIPNEYRAWTVVTTDGRVLTGLVRQAPGAVTVINADGTELLPRAEVDTLEETETSMMPEDLLKPLSEVEVRDLLYYLGRPGQVPLVATKENAAIFFNGKDLTGWDGDESLWRVEDGELVGSSKTGLKRNEFLVSQLVLSDFRLVCEVKLTPDSENSGIQFRSVPAEGGEVRGYQADVGRGWWGKLYEELGRALLWTESGEAHVQPEEWNTYEVLAVGSRIQTAINGHPCVDLDDPAGARQGITAFQLHAGGPLEVRYRNLRLEVDPKPRLETLGGTAEKVRTPAGAGGR